jgi:hypothetical protein
MGASPFVTVAVTSVEVAVFNCETVTASCAPTPFAKFVPF